MSSSQKKSSADLTETLETDDAIAPGADESQLASLHAEIADWNQAIWETSVDAETDANGAVSDPATGPCPKTGDPICLCVTHENHEDEDALDNLLLDTEEGVLPMSDTDSEVEGDLPSAAVDPVDPVDPGEDAPVEVAAAEDSAEHLHQHDAQDNIVSQSDNDAPHQHHHEDDADGDDDHDHHGHGDHDEMDAHEPGEDFVYDDPHAPHHGHGDDAHAHHTGPIQALVSAEDATHFAIADGDWFDPGIWANGEVPGDDARVIVIEGVEVTYAGESDARLATVRVDGVLDFPGDETSSMTVDTLVVSRDASLTIGREDDPASAKTTITFANIDQQDDPKAIGLGLLAEPGAKVAIHGEEKTGRAVTAGNQEAGDELLTFKGGVPEDWEVGDTLVLAGTQHNSWATVNMNKRFEDEVLTITEITEDGVRFVNQDTGETGLRYDHVTPPGFDFDIHVANLTRSVTFQSEDGVNASIEDRGHIMVHDHDSTVKNAAMIGLGRTDKSIELDPHPTTFDINGVETSIDGEGTNVPGRYALHVHRAFDNGDDGGAVDFSGNAIWGTPGWGLVIHGSRAEVHDNVVFGTVGAAIVTEDGDEEAYFTGNTVIQVAGREGVRDSPNDIVSLMTKEGLPIDYGFHGNGFWFDTGYSVREATDNVVASAEHAGMFIYGHNDNEINRYVDPDNAPGHLHKYIQNGVIDPLRVPTGVIEGNQIYNAEYGMFLAGLLRDDQYKGGNASKHGGMSLEHNERNVFEDFDIWGARKSGVVTAYAQGFEFRDMTIVGDPENPNLGSYSRGKDSGILIHKANHNVIMDGIHVEGFHTGLNVGQGGSQGYHDVDPLDTFSFANLTLRNNVENFTPSAGRTGPVPRENNVLINEKPFNPYAILTGTLDVDIDPDNLDPVAQAVATRIDDKAWLLDASASFDPDYQQDAQRQNREVIENSIAFYQWDTDGDLVADEFGRDVVVFFDDDYDGPRYVNLIVTDEQGARGFTSVELGVEPAESRNALGDGGFDIADNIEKGGSDIRDAREVTGYLHKDWGAGPEFNAPRWVQEEGYAQIAGASKFAQILNQLVINRAEHRGEGSFSFDVKYFEADDRPSSLTVKVWGINGAPEIDSTVSRKPKPIYNREEFEAKLLYRDNGLLDDGPFDWKTITADIDFGDGYEYLYVEFTGSRVAALAGDIVAIDNVELKATVDTPEFDEQEEELLVS
ncbi:MAG: G8 domain-containing protein [Pseudomonadota bacterium]